MDGEVDLSLKRKSRAAHGAARQIRSNERERTAGRWCGG